MKKLILFLLIICFIPCVSAQIITGEVEYNAEAASQEVFSSPLPSFNYQYVQKHFIDINYAENYNCLNAGIKEINGRKIARFTDGTYGIWYYNEPLYTWYYSGNGRLINFTQKNSENYPAKVVRYLPDGSITNVGLKVSEEESFVFSREGKLLAHWIGLNCYDEYNNIIMKRKYE